MKHPSVVFLAIAFSGLLVAGCGGKGPASRPVDQAVAASFDLAVMRTVIEGKNDRFRQAHVAGDRATIDGMFAQDAKVLPPDADPVIGRAAIDALTAEYIDYGISKFRKETTDFHGNEDLLIDQGNYVLVYGKEHVREVGKYLDVWKKEGGDWKIQTNIWNTNAPLVLTDRGLVLATERRDSCLLVDGSCVDPDDFALCVGARFLARLGL